jgi:hypothetical protein
MDNVGVNFGNRSSRGCREEKQTAPALFSERGLEKKDLTKITTFITVDHILYGYGSAHLK